MGSMDGARSLSTGESSSNVAILPVQLSNESSTCNADISPPILVAFPEAAFQDCTSFLDLHLLSQRMQTSTIDRDCPQDVDDEVSFVSLSSPGKRKADFSADDDKRVSKVQRTSYTTIATTICRFRVLLRSNDERHSGATLIRHLKPGTILSQVSRLAVVPFGTSNEESWMKEALEVYDDGNNLLAILPIVDTDNISTLRRPHRFTNGNWLKSAVQLCSGAVGRNDKVKMEAKLVLGQQESIAAVSVSDTSHFDLELCLSIYLSLDDFSPSTAVSPSLAESLHKVMRFCFPSDKAEEQIRSRETVTASDVYSFLPSSKLPALEQMQPSLLNPSLFPFQRQSVNFLLGREGKRWKSKDKDGNCILEDVEGVMAHDGVQQLGLWWQEIDENLYYNALFGKLTRDIKSTQIDDIQGGILAEEMGLGKTVEVLALIMLNCDESRTNLPSYYDVEQEIEVSPTKTTLIVAPENLRQQWIDEIALHAPDLETFSYLGYREAVKHVPEGLEWREYSKRFDVMIVSFDTLRKEVNVAKKAPERSRRHDQKYKRPRSLLIQLEFHRVVMDEVQMVASNHGAEETVSMIHRNYSLAVSGTPVKVLADLKSLFHFLGVLPPVNNRFWNRLQSPALLPSLAQCLRILATRHTKLQVQGEMTLPAQTRVLVPINFTSIELAFYKDIYSRALQTLGIDTMTFANSRDLYKSILERFNDDMNSLRSTLLALRQACTHPQIAGSHVRSGNYLAGTALATSNTIRSMDEVLTIMIEGTRADQAGIWQTMARKRIHRVVLLLQDKSNKARLEIAKETLISMLPILKERLLKVQEDAKRAQYIGPLYKFDKGEGSMIEEGLKDMANGSNYHLVDQINVPLNSLATQAEREKEHELAEKRLYRSRHMAIITSRWRHFTEQLHRVYHFLGNVYFQMGEAQKAVEANTIEIKSEDSYEGTPSADNAVSFEVGNLKKLENEAYDRAEETRISLLRYSRKLVDNALTLLQQSQIDFRLEDILLDVALGNSGITTSFLFDRVISTQGLLNRQAKILFKWREETLKRLCKPISRDVSDEDENDDQYQENLDAQAEAEVLTEMYRMVLSQREFLLSGIRIEGSTGKPALYVELERHFKTKTRVGFLQLTDPENEAIRRQMENAPSAEEEEVMKLQLDHFQRLNQEQEEALKDDELIEDELEDGEDDGDEEDGAQCQGQRKLNRINSLTTQHAHRGGRKEAKHQVDVTRDEPKALDTILKMLREKVQGQGGGQEAAIARIAITEIRSMISTQRTMYEKLKKEHLLFMALFNARAAYFKHIQELSDHVSDIPTKNIAKDMANLQEEEAALKIREEAVAGRLRYLTAIEEEEEEGGGEGEEGDTSKEGTAKETTSRTCFICTEPLVRAVIFNTCGHSTCDNCFTKWTMKRGQCPMCKTRVSLRDVYRVTYNAQGKKRAVQMPQEEKRKRQHARYNILSEELARSMAIMPIRSALGSKLDLLTRHLLYLEHIKPGTKSLIFTAFSRGITLVGDALRFNNIKYVALDTGGVKGGRVIDTFKNDPKVNVLLLHSEAQSSGLNLNVCENVFLLEPLVNHSIELQAIGRVHRIGQWRETTVYIYQVNDTVEERIVQLAADRGQSLVTRDMCRSQDLKESAEMIAKTQEGRVKARKNPRDGEFVASLEEIFHCLFDDDEKEGQVDQTLLSTVSTVEETSSSSTLSLPNMTKEDLEREKMRKERVMAIERRQAMNSIERERDSNS